MDNQIEHEDIDIKGMSVCIVIPCYSGVVPIDLTSSLVRTIDALRNYGVRISFMYERENALIDSARNRLTDRFLKETTADKMFCIDADIVWEPEDFIRILALSKFNRVIGATYQARQDPPRYFISVVDETPDKFGLYKIDGMGFGFICIDRDVFVKQSATTETYLDKKQPITRYFATGMRNGEYVGEDMYFIKRSVYEFGETVKLDPSIKLKHFGTKEYTSDPLVALQESFSLRNK